MFEMSKAYTIGAGISSLAAAYYLIQNGWSGKDITIIGLDTHGANDGNHVTAYEDEYQKGRLANSKGFLAIGGRMLNEETYEDLWDMFRGIPSLDHPGESVTDEILNFDHAHPTNDVSRLMDKDGIIDTYSMGFSNQDRELLVKLTAIPDDQEETLDDVDIQTWFKDDPDFFTTNFWYMWQTTFAFQKTSSAAELRRYMHRMILEFSRINTLAGVTRTPYNQYESLILPARKYLQDQGVQFVNRVRIDDLDFADTPMRDEIIVTGIEGVNVETNEPIHIEVNEGDLVFDTNGSITDCTTLGDLDTPITENMNPAPSAALWRKVADRFYNVGNPDKFFGDRSQSEWQSFTVTTTNHLLVNEIKEITRQAPGNALQTWIDSTPLLSIVVHHQPHFHAQKPNETVLWGYVLYPRRKGDYVDKPFIEMTGREMLLELIGHLNAMDKRAVKIGDKTDEIMASVENVIPAYMPYVDALFNNRSKKDRPHVVPAGSHNLAFLGQFTEMKTQMTFTEMMSVRSAHIAVNKFLGLPDDDLPKLNHYDKDPKVLAKAAHTMVRKHHDYSKVANPFTKTK
ncbi:hypothetical protein IV38_GL001172 [Lactobacillus selangorensis]|uniref:Myosin-cross-reactive antigen n=1 Tax=Lactobacillus selangorensis TaxID=81857 RepID=A0A0R2FK01_9LACO|nr:oleate hydratase [Lactobacillus selangorensis]KRN28959.1 hypothetical protein IV38_GL001172 [Lactobacillus selangorensis]KRN32631.1 hypothetical protein IV40_GL000681 [Lactobacillus selangorensis]